MTDVRKTCNTYFVCAVRYLATLGIRKVRKYAGGILELNGKENA